MKNINLGTFHVVLHRPEIPPNTGNIIRLCAVSDSVLHLVGPLSFRLDEASVKRAGMDYRELADVQRYRDWDDYLARTEPDVRTFALTTHGNRCYTKPEYREGDRFLFGSEGSGLPESIRNQYSESLLRIPMIPDARSLNLANSVSIVLYEALRQTGFPGLSFRRNPLYRS
ncbi:MAG: tRNA (cytidine(34)-2'-O)-methyltransferase [Magnetococcales bacterium]|nr:tRNA (cytidine(34)-2'-O)-methyltransferase [Magnetococcales bacterium]